MRRALRVLGFVLAVLLGLLAAVFGGLQTRPGKDALAAAIARLASRPDAVWGIEGLGGTVPFRMTARRIAIADPQGVWLTLRDVRLDIDPRGLLSGELHVRSISVAQAEKLRPAAGPSPTLAEYLRAVHLPLRLVVDRLAIGRLVLAPPVAGVGVAATVDGDLAAGGATARARLDIRRIDGSPGRITLRMSLAGADPELRLDMQASDPGGEILARALGRNDRLPLSLSVKGAGPLTDWHGRLVAAAGPKARLDADLALAVANRTSLGVAARGDLAPLLPPPLAPLLGERATLALRAVFAGRTVVDRLSLRIAAGSATGKAAFGGPDGAVAAHLRIELPDLAKFATIAGDALRGSAKVTAELGGSESNPTLQAAFSASAPAAFGAAAQDIEAHLRAASVGPFGAAAFRLSLAAGGRIVGLSLPAEDAAAARIGRDIDWSLAAAGDLRSLDISRFYLRDGGVELGGSGHLERASRGIAGRIKFDGAAHGLSTGVAAADALLGPAPAVTGEIRRDTAGTIAVDQLALTGAGGKLTGEGRFDPASKDVAASLALDVPRLTALRPALGAGLAGALSATLQAKGPLDRLGLAAAIDGRGLAAGGAALDRLRFAARVADLSEPKAVIDGGFRAGGLDGRLALTAAPIGNIGLAIADLRLAAGAGTVAGDLQIGFQGGLARGELNGRFADLSRWSRLLGTPLAGSLDFTGRLSDRDGGQSVDLTVNAARLAVGSAGARREIGSLSANARLADLRRRPTGTGRLSLHGVRVGALEFAAADMTFDSPQPGRFAFRGRTDGHPLSFALAGEGQFVAGAAELRLARLDGALDGRQFSLEAPLLFSRRGVSVAVSGLALRFGSGRITGSASLRGETLAASLRGTNLPIAAGAQLFGRPGTRGDLSFSATLGGSLAAPQGRFTLDAAGLSVTAARHARTPRLGLTVTGDWNGRTVDLRGQVTGLAHDRMALSGSLPLVLTRSPLAISLPRQAPLSVNLQGGGEIGDLADLLPLGEDRVSGTFAADISVGGTFAAPSAVGRLRLERGRYENFASGAVLTGLSAELVGDGDRFRLTALSAGDGAGGSLKAQGSFALGGPAGASAQLSATLANFRVAAGDEITATASGTISVAGPLAAPRITAPLVIDRAEIHLPNSLPPNVVVLNVTEINGRKQPGPPPAAATPVLDAALDITLRLSGTVLVQGHGLDSQWRGRLAVTGTAAAPKIAGALIASRGSYTLLGKTFRLTRGTIAFDGSAHLDPALDIAAEASAADISAEVKIGGLASSPTVTLASTPPLPRDEILSRVLFGSGVRQISPGQGLELAQAAAALAGGGPGVLDRLRGGLGLDWLRFGQGPATAASSILNPSIVTPATQSAGAVSAGKYIAPGVSVGVTQGVSPPTSKVTVEVDLGHHVTVSTEAGQNIGTGIGLNYNYDY